MVLTAFYHCWALGAWRAPLREFLQALDDSNYNGHLVISAIGSDWDIEQVQSEVDREHTLIHTETGFEQVTLKAVQEYAKTHEGAILYAHTKGAYAHANLTHDPWRTVMTDLVVRDLHTNLALLEDHDVVGWAWLDDRVGWDDPGFAGNFWMARCDYLRRLAPPKQGIRGNAELWVGSASPRVCEREEWDREIGPSALQPTWPLLLQRWRWMAAGMPDEFPAPPNFDQQTWNEIIQNMKDNVAQEAALVETVTDSLEQLARTAINNYYAQQRVPELTEFLRLVADKKPQRVMEIGTYDGGTLWALARVAQPGAKLIALDLTARSYDLAACPQELEDLAQPLDQQLYRITCDSHNPETLAKVRHILEDELLDVLLIDGDHSYEGVRRDWEMYSPLVAPDGIVAFHDIVEHPYHDCHVDRFWRELVVGRHDTREIISGEVQGCGIGLVGTPQ